MTMITTNVEVGGNALLANVGGPQISSANFKSANFKSENLQT